MKLRDHAKSVIPNDVGCTAKGCIWGSPGGMATTGQCRCIDHLNPRLLRWQLRMMARVARHLAGKVTP
jgi:hypothetical protein